MTVTTLKLAFLMVVGVVGDYVLNMASRTKGVSNPVLRSLTPFWEAHGVGLAALSAGLTTLVAGLISFILTDLIMELMPKKNENAEGSLLYWVTLIVVTLVFGIIGDLVLNEAKVFGNDLNAWYAKVGDMGSAVSGGVAILLAVVIAELAEQYAQNNPPL